jgi:hypothetical protein
VRSLVKKFNKTSNLMKIRPVGAELFCVDGRTDRHDKASSRFSQVLESAQSLLNALSLFGVTEHGKSGRL